MTKRSHTVMSVHRLVTIGLAVVLLALPSSVLAAGLPYLDSLSVAEGQISPAFRPTTLFYNVSVGASVSNLTINATPQESSTSVAVNGNTNLQPGTNTIKIVLTSSSLQTQTYTLAVNKAGAVASSSVDLKSLSIDPWTLTPNFSPDITDYSADVDPGTKNLDVVVETVDPNATTAITGTVGLKTGMNTVQITVASPDSSKTKVYTLAVNKLPETIQSIAATVTTNSPKTTTASSSIPWYLIAIVAVIAIAIIVIIVVIVRRRRRRQ